MPNQIIRLLTGRGARAGAGAVLVADGLVGIDVPGGRKRAGLFGSFVGIAAGVAFLLGGIWLHGQHQPYPDGVTTTATVTSFTTATDADGKQMYSRVVSFTASDGKTVQVAENESSNRRPRVGEAVKVSYLPPDPQGARVLPETDWFAYTFIGAGGLVALIALIIFLVRLVTLIAGIGLLASAARRR